MWPYHKGWGKRGDSWKACALRWQVHEVLVNGVWPDAGVRAITEHCLMADKLRAGGR